MLHPLLLVHEAQDSILVLSYVSYTDPPVTAFSGHAIGGESSYRTWRNLCVSCKYLSPAGSGFELSVLYFVGLHSP